MRWSYRTARIFAIAAAAALAGCASNFTPIAPEPPPNATRLGQATGSACGSLGLLVAPYYVIPIDLNTRTETAYRLAVASVPGATGLVDVTIREDWYWWLLATKRCVAITGEAVK